VGLGQGRNREATKTIQFGEWSFSLFGGSGVEDDDQRGIATQRKRPLGAPPDAYGKLCTLQSYRRSGGAGLLTLAAPARLQGQNETRP
jgi:hypothetical protein